MELAELHGQSNVIWSSAASNLVKDISFENEPEGWSSRNAILYIQTMLSCCNWKLQWNAKSSNTLVDMVAKESLSNNSFLFFDSLNLVSLPFSFSSCAATNTLGG